MNDTTTYQETTTTSPSSVALRYGLITGFVSIIFSLILYVTETNDNKAISWLGMIIPIVGIVLAYKAFKSENQGYMSYGQGLGIGTLLATISGILGGIFTYVYTSFIDPTVLTRMREAQILELEQEGMSDEQIDQALGIVETFSGPAMMLVITIVGSVVLGFIISLIVAAIMKNSRPEFE